jgi:hypothetical protein
MATRGSKRASASASVQWTNASVVDAASAYPFDAFGFRGPACAVWYRALPPIPLLSSHTLCCTVLAPPLTEAEAAQWRADPFNFDIEW